MKREAKILFNEIKKYKKQIRNVQEKLEKYQASCDHKYGKAIERIKFLGYEDRWSGLEATEDFWERKCNLCGLVQSTTEYDEIQDVERKPKW